MAPRAASRFRNFVGLLVRGVSAGCGAVLPKMFATSSLQYTPPGGGLPTVPRHWLYATSDTGFPSINTVIVEPLVGMRMSPPSPPIVLLSGVIAHPKLLNTPPIVSPWPGVSIAPKGFAIVSFVMPIDVGVEYVGSTGFDDRP